MKTKLLITFLGLILSASAADAPAYPLTTCVISGEKLGGMGKPFKVTHDGTEVQLCCKSCLKDFNAEPAKYVKMVKDAAAKK
jgi:YHS domain-containing protein